MGRKDSTMHDLTRSNWLGLWTLYLREVRRFAKVWNQTLIAPVVTTLIFLAIFALALGRAVETVGGVPFMEFLAPGLITMAIAQNAFANTSSSLLIAKVQGNIVDTLMPPLTAHELTFGLAMGGVTRGVAVGIVVALAMALFVPVRAHSIGAILYFAIATSLMLSLLGIAAAIWSEKFDQMAAVTNFVITPLSFLSGTFYSIDRLPPLFQHMAHVNPFFYMIDGFRYGIIGRSDVDPMIGAAGFGLLSGLGIGIVYRRLGAGLDTAISMFWSAGMALGVVFVALTPGYAPDLTTYLFWQHPVCFVAVSSRSLRSSTPSFSPLRSCCTEASRPSASTKSSPPSSGFRSIGFSCSSSP
ncbi:MAG: ABC transporter permease [Rhodobacteraceae bacterium]|nr:ABC transporter permease [Paracoccaceae bacterium]